MTNALGCVTFIHDCTGGVHEGRTLVLKVEGWFEVVGWLEVVPHPPDHGGVGVVWSWGFSKIQQLASEAHHKASSMGQQGNGVPENNKNSRYIIRAYLFTTNRSYNKCCGHCWLYASGGHPFLRMYLWWSLCALNLLACQVRVIADDLEICSVCMHVCVYMCKGVRVAESEG